MKVLHWIACLFACHDWTCKAQQGIKPSHPTGGYPDAVAIRRGFEEYAAMYCARCGKVSNLSSEGFFR